MNTLQIRVRYPYKGAKMVLFTELDWEVPVEPTEVNEEKHLTVFTVECDETFLYYKPCLLMGEERFFSRSANYLAIMQADEYEIFPHFFQESVGSVSDVENHPCQHDQNRSHPIRIYVPPGYQENTMRRYPVLYMHDGHNLFFPDEAFSGQTWEVGKTLQLLDNMNLIDPVIVVAIYPRDRMEDYTHPGYESYGRYIVEDIKPIIDERYRTFQDPAFTAVMGSSLGGVVSLYMGWQWPEVFGKVACLSSTFTWKDDLMRRIEDEDMRPLKIYMDSGWPGDNFEVNRAMFDLLQRQGYEVNRELMYLAFPEAEHSEADWATRIHLPFQFLFARYAQNDIRRLRNKQQPARDPQSIAL